MQEPMASVEELKRRLLPAPSAITLMDGRPYHPDRCLGVYLASMADDEYSLRFPGMLAGESVSHHGQSCTMLEGIPANPPSGCIVIAPWGELARARPHLLRGLEEPREPDEYLVRMDDYALLTAIDRTGIVLGAHTLAQMLNCCHEGRFPPLLVRDRPDFPLRALALDLRACNITVENLQDLLGIAASFKAGRVHLQLEATRPLASQPGPGRLTYDEALSLAQTCWEYGIVPVPAVELIDQVAGGGMRPGHACGIARDLLDAFGTNLLCLGGASCPAAGDEHAARSCIAQLREQSEDELGIYLHARGARLLYGEIPPPARVVALVVTGHTTAEDIEYARAGALPVAIHAASLANGFVPPLPAAVHGRLNDTIAFAREVRAVECGFLAGDLELGHVPGNDIMDAAACLCNAWRVYSPPAAAEQILAEYAFAQHARAILDLRQRLAEAFPPCLREPRGRALVAAAFAPADDCREWPAQLDWEEVERRARQLQTELHALVAKLQTNSVLFAFADLGLWALEFIACKRRLLLQARCHYQAARGGRAGGLRLARLALKELLEQAHAFEEHLRQVAATSGCGSAELRRLGAGCRRLADLDARLARLEADGGRNLPDVLELGMPGGSPDAVAPGHDT